MVRGSRFVAARALWRVFRSGRRPGAPSTAERFRALPRLVGAAARGRYRGLSRGRLALYAVAVVYILSPVDVMPELVLTLLGLGDDTVAALWLVGSFLDETDRFVQWERTGDQHPADHPARADRTPPR